MAGRGGPSAPIRARWGDVERPLRRRLEIDLDTVTYAGLISFNESTAMFVVFFERRRHYQPVSALSQGNRMVVFLGSEMIPKIEITASETPENATQEV